MKKQIKLLIENIFDDIYDIDQENNVTIDIADKISYNYYPKNKEELKKLVEQLLEERGPDANLNDINTSNITDMQGLFSGLEPHNIDIRFWDVSNVEDMSFMFYTCSNFNCDLSQWDVSKVKNMYGMFAFCEKFKGDGLENWKVNKVQNMNSLFCGCENFDCNLSNWDVSNVENMRSLFYNCFNFSGKGLEKWKTIKVTTMVDMFYNCIKFDCNLFNWDVSNVEEMARMFYRCERFKGKGLTNWNPTTILTSRRRKNKQKNISSMFDMCYSIKQFPSWY